MGNALGNLFLLVFPLVMTFGVLVGVGFHEFLEWLLKRIEEGT